MTLGDLATHHSGLPGEAHLAHLGLEMGRGCCAAVKMLQFEGYTLDIERNSLRAADRNE